jgi:ATP-dependent helicase/nuclease subunit A
MSLPRLEIIPAGAGSGKTYALKERLGQWVAENEVAPERILAVTFTEAAAAELRERIRAELLDRGRDEDALRLDQAFISTIHGFGLRVLTEFAFEAGISPQPRLLNEDEQDALVRRALTRTDKTEPIVADLEAYGYRYDFITGKSAGELFREDLLRIVELLRSVGCEKGIEIHAQWSAEWVRERYGPTGDAARMSVALQDSVGTLLRAFPGSLARDHGNSNAARTDLQADYRHLRRAQDPGARAADWRMWQQLRNLRLSNRSTTLPEGYDALAEAVIAAANPLPNHPGPLEHAVGHIRTLIAAGQDVLEHYAQAKREAGVVDYGDMIAMAGRLLRERPDVLATLKSRIDCVVVDEFQDTNPLQFDLLWQLSTARVPTVVVGDLKQAIMGFQGADPRLLEALAQQYRDVARPLVNNWRSQPRLMHFVNAIGFGLFGSDYVELEPKGAESPLAPLEVVRFAAKARKDHHAVRAAAVGQRIRELLDDPGQQVPDARSKQLRRLRGSDFAVLCPTHDMLATYAVVLRAQGLRVRLQASGWFQSRPVQLAWHALAYLSNPVDRHAALYLAVTELGSLTLEEGLRQLMEAGGIDEPLLDRLDALAAGASERTVYSLVADTIAALDLFDTVARWPDAEQARANLLRLLAESAEFMAATREALAHGGFHGSGVQTFLAWLAAKVDDADQQPEPRVLDEDAAVLSTWHSAKGREWPVVAVCGLDRVVKARLPNVSLGYPSFDDLSGLLATARIAYAPAFAAPETNDRFLAELQPRAETEARRLLYVALTRARDTLLLEWPEYLGGDSKTFWSILVEDCRLAVEEDAFRVGDKVFPCRFTAGAAALPPDLNLDAPTGEAVLPVVGRRAIRRDTFSAVLTPDSRSPSGIVREPTTEDLKVLRLERFGEGLPDVAGLSGAALGTFLHRCFEVLGARAELLERLPEITGVPASAEAMAQIANGVKAFEDWLCHRFAGASALREWPLLALDDRGTVVSGTADLIVQANDGAWIIDHKSDRVEDPLQAFLAYQPQLEAYARALMGEGSPVRGIAIHWIRRGELVMKHVETIW